MWLGAVMTKTELLRSRQYELGDGLVIEEVVWRSRFHCGTACTNTSGVIDKGARGGVEFPYDRIHIDLEIGAAA